MHGLGQTWWPCARVGLAKSNADSPIAQAAHTVGIEGAGALGSLHTVHMDEGTGLTPGDVDAKDLSRAAMVSSTPRTQGWGVRCGATALSVSIKFHTNAPLQATNFT